MCVCLVPITPRKGVLHVCYMYRSIVARTSSITSAQCGAQQLAAPAIEKQKCGLTMRRPLVIAYGLLVVCSASNWPTPGRTFNQMAMDKHRDGAPKQEIVSTFRAGALLHNAAVDGTSKDAFNNLGVSLLQAATVAERGHRDRHALWSVAALEIGRRLDPLGEMAVIEQNVKLVCQHIPSVCPILEENPLEYWRASVLLPGTAVAEMAINIAQAPAAAPREDEALVYLWQGLQHGCAEEATVWLNLAVACNKARGRVIQNADKFAATAAVGFVAMEHALKLYVDGGTPLGNDGLPGPIRDNQVRTTFDWHRLASTLPPPCLRLASAMPPQCLLMSPHCLRLASSCFVYCLLMSPYCLCIASSCFAHCLRIASSCLRTAPQSYPGQPGGARGVARLPGPPSARRDGLGRRQAIAVAGAADVALPIAAQVSQRPPL